MFRNITGSGTGFLNGRFIFWTAAISVIALFIYLFSNIYFPFTVGFALAYLCAPFVNLASKYINRSIISLILATGSLCVFILMGIEILPRLKDYLLLIAENSPTYYDRFMSFLDSTFSSASLTAYESEISSIKLELQKYLDQKIHIFASIIGEIASRGETIANFFSFFVIMPISFFYFSRDWTRMVNFTYSCVPNRHRRTILEASSIVRMTFSNFFQGQFYVVLILSCYYSVSLFALGIENFILSGIMSGLFSFIPFIGALFSCALIIFVNIMTLTITNVCIMLAVYIIGQFIEGYILSPKFVGKKTGLHPLWILFSFFAGIELRGVLGVLLAIPVAAVIRNLMKFAINKFKSTQAYKQ